MRQCALDAWDAPPSVLATPIHRKCGFLWSREYETFQDESGRLLIPRLVKNSSQNARINSSRRLLTKTLPVPESVISVVCESSGSDGNENDDDALPVVVEQMPGRQCQPKANHDAAASDALLTRVQSSSLLALHVATDIFLFLGIGKSEKDGQIQVLLSADNSSAVSPLASVTAPLQSEGELDAAELLVAVASELLAESIVGQVPAGSHILLHASRSKDDALASALFRRADSVNKGIRVSLSCNGQDQHQHQQHGSKLAHSWLEVDTRAPLHVLRKHLRLARPSHLVDVTFGERDLSLRVAQAMPAGAVQINTLDIYRHEVSSPAVPLPSDVVQDLVTRLHSAVAGATRQSSPSTLELVVPVEHLSTRLGHRHQKHAASGIQWPVDGSLIETQVRPLNARSLFSRDKTYVLVGLTGQLGQSLAEWMASNGAGCVVLTSRRPAVDQRWLDSFRGSGTVVRVMSMDVLDMDQLAAIMDEIRATCPPIGGVANGAMVLEDVLFSNMSAEAMCKVLGPKVDGSRHLDEYFGDDDLDFFVLLSSVAYVVGNAGQANYAAANGYLQTLARQRRARGLAASVIDIGRVAGIGYIEAASDAVREQLRRFSLSPISEVDLRQTFAEAIYAGYLSPDELKAAAGGPKYYTPNATVTTGIREVGDDEDIKGPWFVNAVLSHLITESASQAYNGPDGGSSDSKAAAVPVSQRLPRASSREEALQVLLDALSAKLRVMLQLGESDGPIVHDAPLVELGIDSLVAVEVRSWFLKEVKVDIPVLKIVGGASAWDLCERAFEKLPQEMKPVGAVAGESRAEERKVAARELATPRPRRPAVPKAAVPVPADTKAEIVGTDTPVSEFGPASSSSSTSGDDSAVSNLETPATAASVFSTEAPPTPTATGSLAAAGTGSGYFKSAASPSVTTATASTSALKKKILKSERISLAQSRFWFLRHLLNDQTTPNVTFSYHVTGNLRVGDLERAARIVTTRHEALRTCFVADKFDAGEAYQKVLPSSSLRIEHKKVASTADVDAEFAKLGQHVFNLEDGDVMRIVLLQMSPSDHFLLVNYHHIVMDGVSFQVFLSDLEKAYDGQSLGPPPRQYPDISAAQRRAIENGDMAAELKYWRAVFPPGEQPPVLPLLPMARTSARVAMKDFASHQVAGWLDAIVLERVKAVAKAQRSTPFHIHLAAFKAMLFCLAGPDTKDLTIGIADAARSDESVKGSIGFFLNLLALRFTRQPAQSFADAVAEARNTAYAALSNSRVPFDVLLSELNIARSSSHSPFFQAFIDYRQGTHEKQQWGNVQLAYRDIHPGRTAYDVTLDVLDNPDSVYVMLRVQTGLYDTTAARLLLDTYIHFLDTVTADPALTLEATRIFGDAQLREATSIGRGKSSPILSIPLLPFVPQSAWYK